MIKVNSIETLGALDGPGIRTVIFLQGCPMRCKYCHNPDTFDVSGGEEMPVKQLFDFILRYKNYYGQYGGVTFSGGEPLMQGREIIPLIKLLKDSGINVALDTAGSIYNTEVLDLCDLVILDIKHTDKNGFFALTGHSIDNTLKTLQYLKDTKKRFWIRQVMLDGVTDSTGQILKLKELGEGAEKIELLPFHNMGAHKWEKLGYKYECGDTLPPSKEKMEKLNAVLFKLENNFHAN